MTQEQQKRLRLAQKAMLFNIVYKDPNNIRLANLTQSQWHTFKSAVNVDDHTPYVVSDISLGYESVSLENEDEKTKADIPMSILADHICDWIIQRLEHEALLDPM